MFLSKWCVGNTSSLVNPKPGCHFSDINMPVPNQPNMLVQGVPSMVEFGWAKSAMRKPSISTEGQSCWTALRWYCAYTSKGPCWYMDNISAVPSNRLPLSADAWLPRCRLGPGDVSVISASGKISPARHHMSVYWTQALLQKKMA